ncbi:MAG: hypothetical protein HY787_20160 [Deltaproteobacteria bacterium]|nr:hypothetical protein [Deltaproteobacteria bacterium]
MKKPEAPFYLLSSSPKQKPHFHFEKVGFIGLLHGPAFRLTELSAISIQLSGEYFVKKTYASC